MKPIFWDNNNDEQMIITTATFKVKGLANDIVLLDGKSVAN